MGDSTPGNTQPHSQDQAAHPAEWADGIEIGVTYYPEGRHGKGFIVAYCDGHVKWESFDRLISDWWLWTIEKDGP